MSIYFHEREDWPTFKYNDAALRDIEHLIANGVLSRSSEGGRSTSYYFAGRS